MWDKLPKAFESLRYRNYRLFWFGETISLIGMWMQIVAMGWLIYDITSSKLLLGLINTISGLPVLLLMPIGGLMADHMNKRKILFSTQIVYTLTAFSIGMLVAAGQANFYNIAVIVFIMGIASAADSPSWQSFAYELVEKRSLGNAIALNSVAFNIARIFGPALAGYVIGAFGVYYCFFFNSLSYIPVIFGLLIMRGDFSPKVKFSSSLKEALLEGVEYIWKDKKILVSMLLVAQTSLFIMPYAVLMPVFAKDILRVGAQGLGILFSFAGVGALIGALTLAHISRKAQYGRLIMSSTVSMSLSLIAFAMSSSIILSGVMIIILGWSIVTQAASVNTFIQNEVPNALRGRIMSFYSLFFMGFMPIGAFQAGIAAQFLGARAALVIGAVICLAVAAGLKLNQKNLRLF